MSKTTSGEYQVFLHLPDLASLRFPRPPCRDLGTCSSETHISTAPRSTNSLLISLHWLSNLSRSPSHRKVRFKPRFDLHCIFFIYLHFTSLRRSYRSFAAVFKSIIKLQQPLLGHQWVPSSKVEERVLPKVLEVQSGLIMTTPRTFDMILLSSPGHTSFKPTTRCIAVVTVCKLTAHQSRSTGPIFLGLS